MIWLYTFSLIAAVIMVLFSQMEQLTVGVQGFSDSLFNTIIIYGGGAFVFFYHRFKFNKWAGEGQAPPGFHPRPVRHFTTWIRYVAWNSFYGIMMTGMYALFILFPIPLLEVIDNFVDDPNLKILIDQYFQAASAGGIVDLVPYAVFASTFAWTVIAPLERIEKRIRFHLQENAAIPSQARQLMIAFEEDENHFVPEDTIIVDVIKKTPGKYLEEENFKEPGESLWFLYAKTSYLYHVLEEKYRSQLFSKLREQYGKEFRVLRERVKTLQDQVNQRLQDIQDICHKGEKMKLPLKKAESWLDEYLEGASKAEKAYFQKQRDELQTSLAALSRDVIQLTVCSVLVIGISRNQRKYLLESFGLKNTDKIIPPLDGITLSWIVMGTIGIVFACSVIYYLLQLKYVGKMIGGSSPIPSGMTGAFIWSIYACLMHLTAICGSYIIQQYHEISREALSGGKMRPMSLWAQIAEAMQSASFGVILNIILVGLILAIGGKFSQLSENWWWACVPGVTAVFAALYTQNVERSELEFKRLFLLQGILTGVVALFVSLIIHHNILLYDVNLVEDDVLRQSYILLKKSYLLFIAYSFITCIGVGLALGKILKLWVLEERYSGQVNRRLGARKRYYFTKAKWLSDSVEIFAKAVAVSPSGAELRTSEPLEVDSLGTIEIPGQKKQKAIVVRNDGSDLQRTFIKFLPDKS